MDVREHVFSSMRNLLSLFVAAWFGTSGLVAQENVHERHMERAHPTPVVEPQPNIVKLPFVEEPRLPTLFSNVNMVIAAENDQLPTQNESSIAISPLNPKLMIGSAVDYRGSSSTWAYYSTDGGYSWNNVTLGTARPGWASSNDPSVCFDHTGKGYLCYGGFRRTGNAQFGENGIFISSTTDAGKTWAMKHTAVIIHTGAQTADSAFEDKYYVHADTAGTSPHRGTLYIPWKRVINRDSSTQIMIAKSTDQGATWSTPVAVSERFAKTSEATTFGQSFPLARTGPDGSVHVVWNSGTESAIRYARSTDAGATWSAPRMIHRYNPFGIKSTINGQSNSRVKNVVRAECYPSLAIDNTGGARNGWMYLSWAADNYPNVYVSRSTDNGTTWSDARIVHSDTTNDQFWSWIALDPTSGDVAVMFADSRDDSANILVRTYVSLSTDGGTTWTDRRAGDGNSDLRNNPFTGNTFAGDYSGCDFRSGIVYPSWVDMRNTDVIKADNDVYTAVVNTRAPSSPQRFTATTLPDLPTEIDLSWDAVTTRAFGQPLASADLAYVLTRDGQPLARLGSDARTYRDRGLTRYRKYEYTLIAVVGADTSTEQRAQAWAGGSLEPGIPKLIKAVGSEPLPITCTVELPRTRLDGITPLVNLSKLILTATDIDQQSALNVNDTGRVVTRDVTPSERGWYRVQARAIDADGNESPRSDSAWVFTGNAGYVEENFTREPRYRKVLGSWGTTTNFFRSAPASYAHAPAGPYQPNRRDTLQLMPVVPGPMIPEASLVLQMHVAAFIDATDTMFLEASVKGVDGPYDLLEWWNASRDTRWTDTTKGDDAWREYRVRLQIGPDTTHLRLRFRSNASRQSDGFYMDDITLLTTSVSDDVIGGAITVFPSPASTHCNVTLASDASVDDVWLTDMTGMRCAAPWYQRGTTLVADVQAQSSGSYVLTVRTGEVIRSVPVMIIR
ncbi:MAG: exo-alpha-sialidase [Candidatus Kapabacteria bacterium]|nr:exo-alpha-sialidase [Candidatus Kapabacteria bacterium]